MQTQSHFLVSSLIGNRLQSRGIAGQGSMFTIRPARQIDRPQIRQVIFQAGLIPFRMDWRRFLVAEAEGCIVGVGQVRPHRYGSREVASIAVLPAWQGKGVGTAIVRALVEREPNVLYLFCLEHRESFYVRLGFRLCERPQLPPSLARIYRLANWGGLLAFFGSRRFTLIAMKRPYPLV